VSISFGALVNQFGCWHAISFQYGNLLSAYHQEHIFWRLLCLVFIDLWDFNWSFGQLASVVCYWIIGIRCYWNFLLLKTLEYHVVHQFSMLLTIWSFLMLEFLAIGSAMVCYWFSMINWCDVGALFGTLGDKVLACFGFACLLPTIVKIED
jgi:hypothetical protein